MAAPPRLICIAFTLGKVSLSSRIREIGARQIYVRSIAGRGIAGESCEVGSKTRCVLDDVQVLFSEKKKSCAGRTDAEMSDAYRDDQSV